ncbi:MAG: ABC transporter permease [Chloroflexia bacterium]|nr:ABC transporter permease [Chloroflexia bacterium]
MRRLLHSGRATVGVVLLIIFVVTAGFPEQVAPWDPSFQELSRRIQPPTWISGDPTYVLGGDQLGRDLWSRIVHGARASLLIGLTAVVLSACAGIALGLVAGYFGGMLDGAIMALAEVQLAFPFVLLAITIVSVASPTTTTLIVVLALSAWVVYARLTRARVLSIREQEFMEAARALGAGAPRIIIRHVLPQLTGPLIVVATLELGRIIVLESTLSFLGLGVQAPTISWGVILADGRQYVATGWWISAFSGLAVALAVFAVNTVGDWLTEEIDPTLRMP